MLKLKRIQWNEGATAAANARAVLPGLAQAYFEEGRKLLDTKSTARNLHRFRLATKEFRYTLELFRESYGPSLDRRLELLRPVQNTLGDFSDCASALNLLDGRLHRDRKRVKDFLEKRSAKRVAQFEQYWRGTFDAPGQSKAWMDYLSRSARRRAS